MFAVVGVRWPDSRTAAWKYDGLHGAYADQVMRTRRADLHLAEVRPQTGSCAD